MVVVKFFFTSILVFLTSFPLFSQLSDWEKKFKDKRNSIEVRLDYNDSIMGYYRKFDVDSSMFYALRHLKYARSEDFQTGINYAYSVIASLYRYQGKYDSAIVNYQYAIEGYKKVDYTEGIAATYSNIANVHKQQSRYDLAIKNYFKAISTMKKAEDKGILVNMYSNLAGLYFKLENYDKAILYWDLSTKTSINTPLEGKYTYGYRGKARVAIEMKQYEIAEELIDTAIVIDKKINNQIYLYEDYLILLKLYSQTLNNKKFKEAKQKVTPYLKIDNPINKQHYYEFCGDFYFNTKNFYQAKIFYDSCIKLIEYEENEQSYIEESQRLTSKLLFASIFSENEGANFPIYQKLQLLTEQANEIKKIRLTQELDVQYDLKETKETNIRLDERNRFYLKLNEKNRQQKTLLIIILVIIVGVTIYMVYYGQKLRRIKQELEQNVQEKEFLFKEVNHRVKNNLLIVNSFVGIEKQGKSPEIVSILNEMETRIHSLGLMHELLYKGEMSEFSNLNEYLKKLIDFISKTFLKENVLIHKQVQENIQVNINKIPYIGLIINELITNSIKHAQVEGTSLNLLLQVTENDGIIRIGVSDDGKGLPEGFNLNSVESLGMKMAIGLSKQLKGDFTFESPEKGSAFVIIIPNN